MNENYAYKTQDLKYAVNITAEGFSMDTDEFEIVISVGKKQVVYHRQDLIIDGQGTYYIAIDTSVFKKGDMYATVYAYVPDPDFPDGNRKELYQQKLINLKELQ